MKEKDWTDQIAKLVAADCLGKRSKCEVLAHNRLPYGFEITSYSGQPSSTTVKYETDLIIREWVSDHEWIPRVVIETKLRRITTHDAITYSQKAATHKSVHPYLRYGIILGDRKHYPLPGRLYRHGSQFDFMFSFVGVRPTKLEITRFRKLLRDEIRASRGLEKIIYESRKAGRDRYTLLQRKLVLE